MKKLLLLVSALLAAASSVQAGVPGRNGGGVQLLCAKNYNVVASQSSSSVLNRQYTCQGKTGILTRNAAPLSKAVCSKGYVAINKRSMPGGRSYNCVSLAA
jgi:hypothetical protein